MCDSVSRLNEDTAFGVSGKGASSPLEWRPKCLGRGASRAITAKAATGSTAIPNTTLNHMTCLRDDMQQSSTICRPTPRKF